jgi:hypothetical protein
MTSPPPLPLSLALACPPDPFWERWCRTASAEQQQHILPSAIRSGMVQFHHLPMPGLSPARNALQTLIASIVANRAPSLEPASAADVQVIDASLDEDQRHAVAVALGSPELSLVVGYPGSGKSRVVAEILRQAVGRSQRVLFVAPAGSALDRVVERAEDLHSHILRCAGAGEALPAASVALSLQERIRHFDHHTLPAARQRVEAARGRQAQLAALEDVWPRLLAIPARLDALAARCADLELQRESLASVVEREWSSGSADTSPPFVQADFRREHLEAERANDARLGQIDDRLRAIRGEATRFDDERKSLLSQLEARGRWWTSAFWATRGQPDPTPRLAELDSLLAIGRTELAALEQERVARQETFLRAVAEYAARVAELCGVEVERREAEIARELHEAAIAMAALNAEWSAILPAGVQPAAVEAAERAWGADRTAASQELERRQAWLSSLEQARPGLASDFVVGAHILAAPVSEVLSLGTDRTAGAFDLIVLDDAHRLPEKDLLALARLAPRCVLVGEAGVPAPKSSRAGAPRQSDANTFLRLWVALHPDPVRVSTTWTRIGDRLVARLHPFGPEDEAQIGREPVFDRPEIELAIRTPPGAEPHIVEVGFPASMGVADAKAFLYRESGELAIQPPGPGFRWREAEDGIHLHFGASCPTSDERVPLDAGVVEHLGRSESDYAGEPACCTLGLSFARADGWNRDSAANWVGERLGLRDLGRTASLRRVYRARPALASFLSELLFPRHFGTLRPAPACEAVEFVPVPCGEPRERTALHDGQPAVASPHTNGTTALAPRHVRPRLGAGFEVDLGDGRRLDAIGPELRSALPPRGIANLPEARLIVQTLESFAADSPCFAAVGDAEPHVAVLSLYPAQVELLRLLVRRSTVLADSGLRILVGLPSVLAHRECPVVCLGLTRSHANRAVPFSDDPRDLFLALTRATERLLVFGDPGTMARRSQWFGALDHLTQATGPVEQHVLIQLLSHLPERAAQARPGVVLESSGV